MMMGSYMQIIFNNISSRYLKEEIEKCINDVFFEVFNYKNRIDSKKSFIRVFLVVIKKKSYR